MAKNVLEVQNLRVHFHTAKPERWAVNGVSLYMQEGEIVGLVGESGSGKSVTAMSICGLLPRQEADVCGNIKLDGRELLQCPVEELQDLQGDEISVVFQEPMTAMNPVMKIGPQVEESLRVHHKELTKEQRRERALKAMEQVELPDPERVYQCYPHELSGGMLQRVMIAAAIISKPQILLADEPTTALDVVIQRQIIALLKRLNQKYNMAVLFISHDLNVVRKLCTRVAVMQRGHIVETGPVEEIFANPNHPYTKKLIAACPVRGQKLV